MGQSLDILSQLVYWCAKIYFMFFGILYILALLGKFKMDMFTNITGVIGVLFFLSNLYWYVGRRH
jgi:hypothetical protein